MAETPYPGVGVRGGSGSVAIREWSGA